MRSPVVINNVLLTACRTAEQKKRAADIVHFRTVYDSIKYCVRILNPFVAIERYAIKNLSELNIM